MMGIQRSRILVASFIFVIYSSSANQLTTETELTNATNYNNMSTNKTTQGTSVAPNKPKIFIDNIKNIEEFCKLYFPGLPCNCTTFPEVCFLFKIKDGKEDVTLDLQKLAPCFDQHDKIKGSLILFASVFALIGNSLVILVSFVNWRKYNYCHKLIAGLAMFDFIFAIIQIIRTIPLLWTCRWQYGRSMCSLVPVIYNVSSWIAVGFILIIAIERFQGIMYPLTRGMKAYSLYGLVGLVVVIAITLCVPIILYTDLNISGRCVEVWPSRYMSRIYTWILVVILYIIPVIVIGTLYGAIFIKLWKSSRMIQATNQQIKRLKENKRVMILLMSMLIIFVILILPNHIVWILNDQGILDSLSATKFDAIRVIGQVPYSFHIAINPLLYSVIDAKFRKNLHYLLNTKILGMKFSFRTMSTTVSSRRSAKNPGEKDKR